MTRQLDATTRLCPNGHVLEPEWEICPYCPGGRKVSAASARTVRLDDVEVRAVGGVTPAMPDLQRVAAPAPPLRRTEIVDRPPTMPAAAWIVADSGAGRGLIHHIDRARVNIGARADCDIILDDARVSDHHASVRFKDGEFLVTDLDSTNGTFVNGQLVQQQHVADGDRIRFGSSEWVFKCVVFSTE
jgi:hypothetical protein